MLGQVPVLAYDIGPMSGVVLLDSLGADVTVKIVDPAAFFEGDRYDEGAIWHAAQCRCGWCVTLNDGRFG
jgi:hypothetical protein